MTYLRNALTALAAVLLGVLGPGLVMAFRPIGNSKAIGVSAILGYMLESLLSPWCWILAAACFGLFYVLGRLNSKALRVVLFWMPVSAISTLGVSMLVLFAYLWIRFDRG